MKRLIPSLALAAGLCCQPAAAQVAFIMDMMTVHLCIANNWDTPSWRKQFADLSEAQMHQLKRGLAQQFSPEGLACLRTTRPMPQEACAKVIDKAHGGRPSVGGGEPFIGAELEKELGDSTEKAMRCVGP